MSVSEQGSAEMQFLVTIHSILNQSQLYLDHIKSRGDSHWSRLARFLYGASIAAIVAGQRGSHGSA